MDKQGFYLFLTTKYSGPRTGKPISHRAAIDAVSLCATIEKALGKSMEQLVANEQIRQITAHRLHLVPKPNLVFALNKYFKFRNPSARKRNLERIFYSKKDERG